MSTEVSAQNVDYPGFTIEHIHSPSRLWAIPVVGGAVKFIIVFPVALWLLILQFAASILTIINSFVVLFTGKYWEPAYYLAVGSIRLSTKLNCFAIGLSDGYPGFSLDAGDYMKLELSMPSPAEPLLCCAFDWRFRPHAPPHSFLHILVCNRNCGCGGVLDCLGSRVICGTVSRETLRFHGVCAAAPTQAIRVYVWAYGPLSEVFLDAGPG